MVLQVTTRPTCEVATQMISYLMDEWMTCCQDRKVSSDRLVVAIHSRCTNNLKLKLINLFSLKNID